MALYTGSVSQCLPCTYFLSALSAGVLGRGRAEGREELAEGAWMELGPEGSAGCTPPHSHSLLMVLGGQFLRFED